MFTGDLISKCRVKFFVPDCGIMFLHIFFSGPPCISSFERIDEVASSCSRPHSEAPSHRNFALHAVPGQSPSTSPGKEVSEV